MTSWRQNIILFGIVFREGFKNTVWRYFNGVGLAGLVGLVGLVGLAGGNDG